MKNSDLIIADEILSNQISLMRLIANERQKVFDILLKMQTELKMKLLNDFTSYTKARMDKLLNQCTAVINQYYSDLQGKFDLSGISKQQAKATAHAMASIGVDVSIPSAATLKAMVSDTLLTGAPLSAWWDKQAEETAFKFTAQVRQGIVQGETMQQIITRVVGSESKGIPGVLDVSRRYASTLVHDSVMQVANDSKMATYQENSDVLNGMQQLSTLDSHTSQICIAYSGAQWDLDGNPINGNSLPFDGGCPRHPNCRSVIVPITKTYKELGVNVPEMTGGSRASDLGQIPADTTFNSFLNRHDVAYQDELLGKGKAEMWRSGKITLRDLVSQNGRPLTLAQLSAQ